MTTNVPGTRTSDRPGDPTTVDTATTPVLSPTGVGGVAVFDRDVEGTSNPSLRPSASTFDERGPVEARSTGSILGWIIGAIVLIVLAYFLLQMIL